MNEWKKVRIGDFLTERKGRYKPNDEKLIGIQRLEKIDFSGKIFISDKDTKTDMILVYPGDLVISGINVSKGAIAVYKGKVPVTATIHYSSYIFDDSIIDLDYFKYFVKSQTFIEIIQKQIKGGIKTEVKSKNFLPLEISLPDLETQKQIVQKISKELNNIELLKAENEHQKDYAKKLRQNILQDAIQGTLTKEWRKENEKKLKNETNNPDYNATALFEKIQKIKKGEVSPSLQSAKHSSATPSAGSNAARNARLKQYSPITEEEKSFEIPNNWKWVRLGEIANKITDGTHNSPINTSTGDFMYVTAKNIKSTGVDLSNITFITSKIHNEIYSRCNVEYGDLLFIKDGATTGIVCLNNLKEQFSLLSSVALIKTSLNNNYLKTIMGSPFFYNQTRQNMYGVAIPRVTLQKIENAIIPLPPLLEQKEIVSKVEQLLSKVEEIEKEIENRATIIKQITQSTLKDAFNVR